MSVDIEYRPQAGGQLSITDMVGSVSPTFVQQWPLLTKIDAPSPSESQARVLLRKDGQPDRRQFKQFQEKQPWEIFGEFAVADIRGSICVVSACDVPIVEQHRWYLKKSGQNHYAATGQGFFMHRMLLGLEKGDERHADHRDNYGLNNWRDNLRLSTAGQNRCNSRKLKAATSHYKGVRLAHGKWAAAIGRKYLGLFSTEIDAAKAYDAAATKAYGEFARLNFTQKAA